MTDAQVKALIERTFALLRFSELLRANLGVK